MVKKKKYMPPEDDGWDIKSDRKHRKLLREKERKLREKYKQGWDLSSGSWKEGFLEEWYDGE
jgi:hypothetical protein|tara:strand:- start:263 stop:448 length:186 start_codon:yes stop_codon:yes gene_type:complete